MDRETKPGDLYEKASICMYNTIGSKRFYLSFPRTYFSDLVTFGDAVATDSNGNVFTLFR